MRLVGTITLWSTLCDWIKKAIEIVDLAWAINQDEFPQTVSKLIVNNHEKINPWLFNIAMENGPFIDGLPIKNGGSFHGYVK